MESSSDKKTAMREPLLTAPAPTRGGFRTLPFILANVAFEKVASYGLIPNMILYLTKEYAMEAATGATVLFIWSAMTNFTPIIGAFLGDSYVGRYRMIGFGSIISLLGMILFWLTTMFPQARPPPCDQLSDICEPPTTSQLLVLYSSFGLISIGLGGIRSSSLAFGADQLNTGNNAENAAALQSYFNWYYASLCFSSAVAITFVVYIQDNLGWKVGFGVPVFLMFLSTLSFFSASSLFIKLKPKTSLFTGFAQALVASYRNRHIKLSSQATDEVYYHRKGSMLLVPSENLRFLNKACVVRNPEEDLNTEGNALDEWRLCTVDQVEELKELIRLMPLWSTGIMSSVTVGQDSFAVIQVSSMDRHITPKLEIPAGSFSVFMVISMVIWILVYDRVVLPVASKIKGKSVHLSFKQRVGIGMIFASASMAAVAIVESIRRKIAVEQGLSDDSQVRVQLSAMWLLPYHFLSGLAEAFVAIGLTEFFYTQLPKKMGSISSNLFGLGISAASLVASLITSTVDDITKRSGGESWVSTNINKGHYDYYFWLLAGLSLLNFFYFLACSKAYGPCKGNDSKEGKLSKDEDEVQ